MVKAKEDLYSKDYVKAHPERQFKHKGRGRYEDIGPATDMDTAPASEEDDANDPSFSSTTEKCKRCQEEGLECVPALDAMETDFDDDSAGCQACAEAEETCVSQSDGATKTVLKIKGKGLLAKRLPAKRAGSELSTSGRESSKLESESESEQEPEPESEPDSRAADVMHKIPTINKREVQESNKDVRGRVRASNAAWVTQSKALEEKMWAREAKLVEKARAKYGDKFDGEGVRRGRSRPSEALKKLALLRKDEGCYVLEDLPFMGKDVADDDLDTRKPITSCRASLVCYKILEEADSAGYLKRTAGILSIEPGRTAADSSLAFNSNEEGEVQHDLRVLLPNLKKKFSVMWRETIGIVRAFDIKIEIARGIVEAFVADPLNPYAPRHESFWLEAKTEDSRRNAFKFLCTLAISMQKLAGVNMNLKRPASHELVSTKRKMLKTADVSAERMAIAMREEGRRTAKLPDMRPTTEGGFPSSISETVPSSEQKLLFDYLNEVIIPTVNDTIEDDPLDQDVTLVTQFKLNLRLFLSDVPYTPDVVSWVDVDHEQIAVFETWMAPKFLGQEGIPTWEAWVAAQGKE